MLEEKRLMFVVAASGAVLMCLEILGSRVLAPYFGSSVYVWGSLITTFLLALAIGYALGGRIADRRPEAARISLILAGAAILILPCIHWAPRLLSALPRTGWDVRWMALTAALILFLPPSLAMGMVSPFAVRLAVSRLDRVGSIAGAYSALSTAGSIVGTLVATFVLIPRFPVQSLLLGMAITLALCALLMMRGAATIIVAVLAAATCGVTALIQRAPMGVGSEKIIFAKDTAYHHIVVTEMYGSRYLRFDDLTQNYSFTDPAKWNTTYDDAFLLAWAFRPLIQRACLIGLGGGNFPRKLARVFPDVFLDSVEIDPVVRKVAEKYFFYKETDHARTIIQDGRVFLAQSGEPYDLIILDAYNSTGVPFHLMTREAFEIVRRRLTSKGIFVANFVGRLMGKDDQLFWACYRTLRRQFGQVYIFGSDLSEAKKTFSYNAFVFATVSADPMSREELEENLSRLRMKGTERKFPSVPPGLLHSPDPPPGVPELTDAYAPVEALQNF